MTDDGQVINLLQAKKILFNEIADSQREVIKQLSPSGHDYYPCNDNNHESEDTLLGSLESYLLFSSNLVDVLESINGMDEDMKFVDENGDEFTFCPDEPL